MKRFKIILIVGVVALISLFATCDPTEPIPEEKTGNVQILFTQTIDGVPLQCDTMIATNAAGNLYQVNEIQYFISDVMLYKNDGTERMIEDWDDIHYVDTDLPGTMQWDVFDDINIGDYDGMSFVFGIRGEKNTPYMYVNPPELNMFWPEFLGGSYGGYHYLKLNGKWLTSDGNVYPFDYHLGVGQIYSSSTPIVDSITEYVQNWFVVDFPTTAFEVIEGQTTSMTINMEVQNWFNNPVYDHDYWSGSIMQNQDAQIAVKANGDDVFTLSLN